MDRRNFFKLVGTASGGAISGACGNEARQIIPLLVPEEQIVPGVEQWRPSVCRECGAGCGTIVRLMEAERTVELGGETVRQKVAAVKKVEGNPLDPVSGGRLCARGQASVQSLYHPDRLRGPQKRTGNRGSGEFEPITWEDALNEASRLLSSAVEANPRGIVYLTRGQLDTRAATIARFLEALGAEPASTVGFGDFTIERKAAELVYGWDGLPVYDIQDATYVLGIGADFLGGWASPVLYARRFGHMRQGRPSIRGMLIHAESRFSQTGWSADRWLPVRPGGELAFALAIGHLLLKQGAVRGDRQLPEALRASYESVDLNRAVEVCGVEFRRLREVAEGLTEASAPVVIAGASIVQSNSLEAVVAASGLNILLGAVENRGGVMPPAPVPIEEWNSFRPAYNDLERRLQIAEVVLLDNVNPVHTWPASVERLAQAKGVISFASILDDSAAFADLILPDHSSFESAVAATPHVAPVSSLTGSRSFVRPLYDTRGTEQVLTELAAKMDRNIDPLTPDKAFQSLYEAYEASKPGDDWETASEFAQYAERQGGWWFESARSSASASSPRAAQWDETYFEGDAEEYPYLFQPYPSLQFGDGDGAALPWLQQTPDPTSSAMWNLPVEIDPSTASALGLENGQMVRVTSPVGSLEAPAYVNPAAIPGVVSMAIGQGHRHFGRYASGRGANPLAITAAITEKGTGVPAFGATRVRLENIGERGRLAQFSIVDREPHPSRR